MVSLAECMAQQGIPKSTVGIPRVAPIIAPTVLPQGMSDLEAYVCSGILCLFARAVIAAAVDPVVAYLELNLIAGPFPKNEAF